MPYLPMKGLFRPSLFVMAASIATAACASSWPVQRTMIDPGSALSDSVLDGRYQVASIDGKTTPVEYPSNPATKIVYGTLDLHDAAASRAGAAGTYSVRLGLQPANDTLRTTADDGTLALRGDTLVLTSKAPAAPASRYRFAWLPNGNLALTDGNGHVWVYTRR